MIIGIDIDGVLCNLNGYVHKYFKKYLEENNIPYKFDKTKEYFNDQFHVEKDYEIDFWRAVYLHYAKKVVMKNQANLVTHKLHKEGHKLIIVTSRLYSTEDSDFGRKIQELVLQWLEKHKIYYDKIFFCDEKIGKLDVIKEQKIDVMIDDSLRNINEISEIIPVFVFRNSANRKAKGKNKIIVNGWKDIYKNISKMSKAQNKEKTLK